jgi:hypothetical protein
MKKTSNKLLLIAGIILIITSGILIFKVFNYTKNATILQGEQIENSDSVKVLINGQYQTTAIVKRYENEQDSTKEFVVTSLGVVEISKTMENE